MKFIHVGDLHLGAQPDKERAWSSVRQTEIWDTFTGVIERCNREKVDLLLLSGDIFHSQPLVRQLKDLDYQLSKLVTTKVVMIAGNHDYIKENSRYGNYEWNSNVNMLSNQEIDSVYFQDMNTEVYGFSYHAREMTDAKIDSVKPTSKERINILMAHGGDAAHMPINFKSLQYSGFHYVALGHIHLPQVVVPDLIAYAGILEPIDKTETGDRGYIQGEITRGETKYQFVKANKRNYMEISLKVTPETSNAELKDRIKNAILNHGREHIYIFKLVGFHEPSIELEVDSFFEFGNIVEIDNQTQPDYEFKKLYESNKDNLIGHFIGELLPEVEAGKVIEKKALYYGLKALLAAKEGK